MGGGIRITNAIMKKWTENIIIRDHMYIFISDHRQGGWGVKNICLCFWPPRHFFSGAIFRAKKIPTFFPLFSVRFFPMLECTVLH